MKLWTFRTHCMTILGFILLGACAPIDRYGYRNNVGSHEVTDHNPNYGRYESGHRERELEHIQREVAEIQDRRRRGIHDHSDDERFEHLQDELNHLGEEQHGSSGGRY